MLEISRLRRLGVRSLLIVITLAGFGAAFSQVDLASLSSALRNISAISLIIVMTALVAGAMLAAFRLKLVAADIGYPLSMRDAVAAMSVGQIASTIFFQFFGQIAGRSALLGSRGISVPANVMITTYERLLAFGVSATLAIAGGWFLFGHVVLDMDSGGGKFLRILAGIVIAIVAGAALAWGRMAYNAIRPFANRRAVFVFGRIIAFTLFVQLATAAAYVLAAKSIVPDVKIVDVLAASVVVMFAASLPISFSGWGVREMSAVLALSAIGVPSGAALTISVIIGIMALVVVIALAGLALATPKPKALPQYENRRAADSNINIDAMVAWILPVAAATAVFFQILIPSGAGFLNVNLADPIAILGGIIFVVYFAGKSWPQWRLPGLNFYVIATSAVVVLSYLHGYFEFGWSDWAFRNKLLGWFVLLGYGATGSLIARRAGRAGLEVLLTTFIVVAAAIIALDLAMILATRVGIVPIGVLRLPMEGFSQNRNAFGFLLLLAVCGTPFLSNRAQPWLLAILLLGVWFSGSRAVGGALLIVVATMVVTGFLSFRIFLRAGLAAGAFLLFIAALPTLISAISTILPFLKDTPTGDYYPLWVMGTSPDASLAQRWQTITGGITLFLNNPIFGAGLGAYMEAQIKAGEPLVIHSTTIWLLAEMGIVGFGVLALPLIQLFFSEVRAPREKVGVFLILIIMAFVITASVHEMLYQRAFWLLLGGALACVPRVLSQATNALNERADGREPVYEHQAA